MTKTIIFQGQTYEVPDWAKYVAQDEFGTMTAFECKPIEYYDDHLNRLWTTGWPAYTRYHSKYEVVFKPKMICEELP